MNFKVKLRRLTGREIRFLIMLIGVAAVGLWKFAPRPWDPTFTTSTQHYLIASTAAPDQVERVGKTLELLYAAYSNKFGNISTFHREHPKLHVRLYKSRDEFRHVNPSIGWAEAFYSRGLCHAYCNDKDANPYQWMLHECVHQLNREVAGFSLEKWLDEGMAEYFSCSRIRTNGLILGTIDLNTYPVWWLDEIAKSPNLRTNIANGNVILLRAIITGKGGPDLDKEFNLYYLHWWSLSHFIFEHPVYGKHAVELAERGGDLKSFEDLIGPVETIQSEWHEHVRRIKSAATGKDRHFWKTGELR
jgi:hypothetical protein